MNKRIILCNVVFYLVTLLLFAAARQNQSASLGYSILLFMFWAVSLLTLIILLSTKIIRPVTIADKVGIVLATPLCSMIIFTVLAIASNETRDSEWHFDNGDRRYKQVKYSFRKTGLTKRIEYYKRVDTVFADSSTISVEQWIRDSTWIYFSETGDTLKTVKFKDDVEVR